MKKAGEMRVRELKLPISREMAGKKVLHMLRGELGLSVTLVKSLKWREGAILLNGAPVTVDIRVHEGDVLTVNVADRAQESVIEERAPLPEVLWEDDDLLIINKPSGVAVHASALTGGDITVEQMVVRYLGGGAFHPVNRLDRGVSGVMVVAKSGYAHARTMAQLHSSDFRREYRAVCRGIPSPAVGEITLPIGRDTTSAVKRKIDPEGKAAHTVYEVLSVHGETALLRLQPITGRTHQLRLHMASLGHPLLGDWLYGEEHPLLPRRIALHSYELWLRHPVTGEVLHIVAPIPEEFEKILK